MRKVLAILMAGMMLMTAGCGQKFPDVVGVTITMENGDVMKGELYHDKAPETVENFVKLAEAKAYDGLIFHRVIEGFMIQGGGYNTDMKELKTEPIKGEFSSNGFENDLKHERGVISMARTSEPNSAASQFFIMQEASEGLDGNYAAFGKITEGLEVIDKIAGVETTTATTNLMALLENVPVEQQVIASITIER